MKVFSLISRSATAATAAQVACKDEHVANDWMPYAKPQPDTGQFWVKVQENVRGTVPKVRVSYIPEDVHALRRRAVPAGVQGRRDLQA